MMLFDHFIGSRCVIGLVQSNKDKKYDKDVTDDEHLDEVILY